MSSDLLQMFLKSAPKTKMVVAGRKQSNVIHFHNEVHFACNLYLLLNFKGVVDIFGQLNFQAVKRME